MVGRCTDKYTRLSKLLPCLANCESRRPGHLAASPRALAMQLEVGHSPFTMLQFPWQSAGLDEVQRPTWPISCRLVGT